MYITIVIIGFSIDKLRNSRTVTFILLNIWVNSNLILAKHNKNAVFEEKKSNIQVQLKSKQHS